MFIELSANSETFTIIGVVSETKKLSVSFEMNFSISEHIFFI